MQVKCKVSLELDVEAQHDRLQELEAKSVEELFGTEEQRRLERLLNCAVVDRLLGQRFGDGFLISRTKPDVQVVSVVKAGRQ